MYCFKHMIVLTAYVVLMMSVGTGFAIDEPTTRPYGSDQSEEIIKDLSNEVVELHFENKALREQIKIQKEELRKLRDDVRFRNDVPPDWKSVPFNGGMYYIIPLSGRTAD